MWSSLLSWSGHWYVSCCRLFDIFIGIHLYLYYDIMTLTCTAPFLVCITFVERYLYGAWQPERLHYEYLPGTSN